MDAVNQGASEPAGLAPSVEDVRKLRAHPRFAQALRVAVEGLVEVHDGNRLLNQVLNDRGRVVLGGLALYLHFSGTGLTASRLMALCAETSVCSRNRAAAMVALMRFSGYLETAPGPDRRSKVLVPTARMLAVHQEREAGHFRAMALLMPEGRAALDHVSDIAFTAAVLRHMGERFRAGLRVLDHLPELALFTERNAGLVIAFSLMLAGGPHDAFPPARPVRFSLSALSRRFGVSRAHVLRLLQEAERQGFVRRGAEPDEIVLLAPLVDGVESFLARIFLFMADAARGALAEIDASPHRPVGRQG